MAKLTLTSIDNLQTGLTAINENFAAIEAAFENTVSRNGMAPNYLTANLDMNGQGILNAQEALTTEPSEDTIRPIFANGEQRAAIVGTDTNTELVLYSGQDNEPYANNFIRFREPGGTTKGVLGFTASGDNTFSMTSYEDHRLKFRTGTPGDTTSFIDRAAIHGNATSSWVAITSGNLDNDDIGGCFIRFTESDVSQTKGYVGYASTENDGLSIINTVDDENVSLTTAGTGAVAFKPGGTEAVSIKSTGQINLVPLASDPASPADGDLWFNSTAGKLRFRVNAVTIDLN